MKAIRKSDGKIVEVQPHGWRNGETISYHSNFKDFYKPEQLDFNVIETKDVGTTEKPFDWQSFRAEAAKDILCHLLDRYTGDSDNKGFVTQSIGITDELIKQLKEKEVSNDSKSIANAT